MIDVDCVEEERGDRPARFHFPWSVQCGVSDRMLFLNIFDFLKLA